MQFTDGCSVTTPLTSKGHGYTLSFTLKQTSSTPGPLFSGPDSELRSGNGTFSKVMLVSAGNAFPLNYSLRVGEWVDASLIARGNRTFFAVDGGSEMEFMAKIGINGESFAWVNMAVVAPLETIGGGNWEGEMKGVKLVDYA
jgi:hexosaminidase